MSKTIGEKWHGESQALGALEGIAVTAALFLGFAVFVIIGACSCDAFGEERQKVEFDAKCVSDILVSEDLGLPDVLFPITALLEEQQEEAEEEYYEEPYYEDYYYEEEYYDYGGYSGGGSSDGFMEQGIREGVDSDTETWYSSNQAYHYRTSEWSPDEEGYYRDSDGYYVVASDDYPEGTVIETSKGEAIVLDSGTDSGNVDFYTNW
jgi:hypothetical protein